MIRKLLLFPLVALSALATYLAVPKDDVSCVYRTAMKEMGEGYDIDDFAHGGMTKIPARFMQYVKEVGESPDALDEGWCSAFTAWCLKQNGFEYARGNSNLEWTNVTTVTHDPHVGDIALFCGHIAIVAGFFFDHHGVKMLNFVGGCQAGRVCVLSDYANRSTNYLHPIKAPKGWT